MCKREEIHAMIADQEDERGWLSRALHLALCEIKSVCHCVTENRLCFSRIFAFFCCEIVYSFKSSPSSKNRKQDISLK